MMTIVGLLDETTRDMNLVSFSVLRFILHHFFIFPRNIQIELLGTLMILLRKFKHRDIEMEQPFVRFEKMNQPIARFG